MCIRDSSTTDSGSVSLGSNPGTPALLRHVGGCHGPVVELPSTPPSQGGSAGSNPVGATWSEVPQRSLRALRCLRPMVVDPPRSLNRLRTGAYRQECEQCLLGGPDHLGSHLGEAKGGAMQRRRVITIAVATAAVAVGLSAGQASSAGPDSAGHQPVRTSMVSAVSQPRAATPDQVAISGASLSLIHI